MGPGINRDGCDGCEDILGEGEVDNCLFWTCEGDLGRGVDGDGGFQGMSSDGKEARSVVYGVLMGG